MMISCCSSRNGFLDNIYAVFVYGGQFRQGYITIIDIKEDHNANEFDLIERSFPSVNSLKRFIQLLPGTSFTAKFGKRT